MFRTVLTIGVFALLGMFALKVAFGLFGIVLGLFTVVLFFALKVALIGLAVYVIVRIVSPDTAKRWRERLS
jgi:hypothetical protein